MNINELEIANWVYGLNLSDEDFTLLSDACADDKSASGQLYLIKKGDYAIGVSNNYSRDDRYLVSKAEEYPNIPVCLINSWKILFVPTKEDSLHIDHFTSKYFNHHYSYRSDDCNNPLAFLTASSIDEFKQKIRTAFIRNCNNSENLNSISKEDLNSWFWLFDKSEPQDFHVNARCKDDRIRKILHVFEFKNHRFSLSASNSSDNTFRIKIFSHESPEYNYIDAGRIFCDHKYIWSDLSESEIDYDVVMKCGEHSGDFGVITREIYEACKKRFMILEQKEKEDDEYLNAVRQEIDSRFSNLDEKPLTVNGITFSISGISYEGQQITGIFEKENRGYNPINTFREFYEQKVSFTKPESLDFNLIFEMFCDVICGREFEGILGTIPVKVTKKATESAARLFINTVRINKEDICDMLKRALCFDNLSEYNSLLKDVSKCSLKFHDLLSNGLRIEYQNPRFVTDGSSILKLTIIKRGKCNFLLAAGKEYRIADTNRLISRSTLNKNQRYKPSFAELIDLFKDLFGMTKEDIILTFNDGIKEYKQAVEKSKQFLSEAIELFNVREVEKEGTSGYLVEGKSKRKYLLTKDCKIFDYDTMDYICIVDKNIGKGFLNDRLANRMFALANDSLVAANIDTLQKAAA